MRNVVLTVATMALTVVVIGNAYVQKKQFYPSVVYITKSNPSMAVSMVLMSFEKLISLLYVIIFLGYLLASPHHHLADG